MKEKTQTAIKGQAFLPYVQILLIEKDKHERENHYEEFHYERIGIEKANSINLEFVKASNPEEALNYIAEGVLPQGNKQVLRGEHGDIQAILIGRNIPNVETLIEKIQYIRSGVHIFMITMGEEAYGLYNPRLHNIHIIQQNDLENNYCQELQRIINTFNERRRTPFWSAYREYVEKANYSWHTPGHAGGLSFKNSPYLQSFYNFYGANMFLGDLSVSVERLGSLLDSTGFVGEVELKAAKTFNVLKTFFVTNGSSTSNKIILQTLMRPGEKAIIDSNCHKSIHYGMIQAHATPIYLHAPYSDCYGIFAPPTFAEIEKAVLENPDAKVIVLTGCTYDGILTPIRRVVEMVKRKNAERGTNLKVFIDEAWFAYSSFHPQFKEYSAVLSGADYITHSAHKVLSAFSQSSYIHVNDPDFDEDYFLEIFYTYTSTSPQYHIIASLGVCSMQMEIEGFKLISKALQQAQRFREAIRSRLTKIKVIDFTDLQKEFNDLENCDYGHDPLKVLLDVSDINSDVKEIQTYLQNKGFEVEKTTQEGTILFLFTIGTTASKEGELFFALNEIENDYKRFATSKTQRKANASISIPKLETAGLIHFYSDKEELDIADAEGRISSFIVTPYPPGIPVLVPGQTITHNHIDYLERQIKDNRSIHGLRNGKVFVVKK
ncbi:MAG: hypothetical protein LBL90_13975 [Prevotellaceae bacterium]|nr:hypothetical protein [Prevotellaceae bacterium]